MGVDCRVTVFDFGTLHSDFDTDPSTQVQQLMQISLSTSEIHCKYLSVIDTLV